MSCCRGAPLVGFVEGGAETFVLVFGVDKPSDGVAQAVGEQFRSQAAVVVSAIVAIRTASHAEAFGEACRLEAKLDAFGFFWTGSDVAKVDGTVAVGLGRIAEALAAKGAVGRNTTIISDARRAACQKWRKRKQHDSEVVGPPSASRAISA